MGRTDTSPAGQSNSYKMNIFGTEILPDDDGCSTAGKPIQAPDDENCAASVATAGRNPP